MNQRTMYIFLVAAMLVLGACTAGGSDSIDADAGDPTTTTATSVPDDSVTEPIEPEGSNVNDAVPAAPLSVARSYGESDYPGELEGIIMIAVNDLAERLGLVADDITILSVEEVVWSDASVGCPDPEMNYAQVVTDGLRIVLDVEGVEYAYHSGGSVDPFLCVDKPMDDRSDATGAGEDIDITEISTTEGTLQLEKVTTPKETAPTEQPGGPGGQPDK